MLNNSDSRLVKAAAKYGIASVHRRARNYDAATKGYEEVLVLAREHLHPRHPVLGMLLGDMAGMYQEVGNVERAEELLEEGLEIGRQTIPTHEMMIEALIKYGEALERRSEHAKAESLYLEAADNASKREQFGIVDGWRKNAVDHLIGLATRENDQSKIAKYQEMLNTKEGK